MSPLSPNAEVREMLGIGPDDVFIIAEIGINHNGDMTIAKRLIDTALTAGCNAVKFQKRTVDVVYSQEVLDTPRESPWGNTTREQKHGLEFGKAEYDEIDRYCRERGITWFASAWDLPAQQFLSHYELPLNKIASAMGTHTEFVRAVARERKLTFASTGMMSTEDVDALVSILSEERCPFVLMHTVSVYPCPEDQLHLNAIDFLRDRYNCPVAYSGHESTVMPSVIAATKGIVALERHITLDRAMYGSDQAASLAPRGLIELVSEIRRIPATLGRTDKFLVPGEDAIAAKLRYWS